MALSATDIRDLTAFGREQAGVEFKSAGARTDPALRAKVIRGMLAMANRRDGGTLIVGIKEHTTGVTIDGLTADQLKTWQHDDLADAVAEYADPRLVFDSSIVDVDGQQILVISVEEFADVPVVCRRTLHVGTKLILREGAVYVRSNRKPESCEISNYDEMRELLDIATDKGVRRFVARATEAGLTIGATVTSKDSRSAFKAERGDL